MHDTRPAVTGAQGGQRRGGGNDYNNQAAHLTLKKNIILLDCSILVVTVS